jgi:NAD(P)-dependent dehydrogenase (short-subunit alcohol dehydrogenase family)
MNLSGKTIVVTGASSGIGGEVVRLARFSGARVIGLDRNDPLITMDGFVKVDLGDPTSIDAAITQLPRQFDGLVNAAGVPGTASRELVGRVNYLGLRRLTEGVVDQLKPGASIVNFASVLGGEWQRRLAQHKALATTTSFAEGEAWLASNPVPQDTCYQYFKEALIVWTFARAQEWFLKHDLRMNCVAPGPVFTPILGDFVTMLGEERVANDAPRMKRPGFGDEIAPPVTFLLSDAARWINGINLPIDGGLASTYI